MILPKCGHTFCSRCIRSYLDSKGPVLGDCPSCRERVRPDELVRNVKLKEVIAQYRELEAALQAAAGAGDAAAGASAAGAAAAPAAAAAEAGGAVAKRTRASRRHEPEDSDFEDDAPAARKRPRSVSKPQAADGDRRSSRLSARSHAAGPPASPDDDAVVDVVDLSGDSKSDSSAVVRKRASSGGDGRVECPICNMSVSERNISWGRRGEGYFAGRAV